MNFFCKASELSGNADEGITPDPQRIGDDCVWDAESPQQLRIIEGYKARFLTVYVLIEIDIAATPRDYEVSIWRGHTQIRVQSYPSVRSGRIGLSVDCQDVKPEEFFFARVRVS